MVLPFSFEKKKNFTCFFFSFFFFLFSFFFFLLSPLALLSALLLFFVCFSHGCVYIYTFVYVDLKTDSCELSFLLMFLRLYEKGGPSNRLLLFSRRETTIQSIYIYLCI